ncbi:MAG: FHA domain-containing protein [Deltaproteobacteria bacterium]|nr:FHA domain-containing protein [Deltaproteobacteria bacterium]
MSGTKESSGAPPPTDGAFEEDVTDVFARWSNAPVRFRVTNAPEPVATEFENVHAALRPALIVKDAKPEQLLADPDVEGALVVVHLRAERSASGNLLTLDPRASPINLGRDAANHFVLTSSTVSRRHAQILRRPDGWWLLDQQSTNGSRIGNARVREQRLADEDRVQLGDVVLKCLLGEGLARRQEALALHFGTHDGMTDLANRQGLLEALTRVGSASGAALLALDLVGLGELNRRHGDVAGDDVVYGVAELVRALAPEGSVAGRLDGGTFALVLPATDVPTARSLGETLCQKVAATVFLPESWRIRATLRARAAPVDDAPAAVLDRGLVSLRL